MQYIDHETHKLYSCPDRAHWRDILVTSDPPDPWAKPVVESGVHVGWESNVPADAVVAERQRRLALGFTYDFGDARGVHEIGTTLEDMEGWGEVTQGAMARHALGSTTPISIVTNTGPVEVTPAEWLAILDAATTFRQPIWHASFILQATDPIPADYTDDKWWP